MANTISNRQFDAPWKVIQLSSNECAASFPLPAAGGLFPLSVWLARKQEVISRYKRIGLWLHSGEALAPVVDDLHYFQIIAIDFPSGLDQRGCATARVLREHYQFQGQVWAIGHVLPDDVLYLKDCGFDAFPAEADCAIDVLRESLLVFPRFGRSEAAQTPVHHRPAPVIDFQSYLRTRVA